MRKFVVFACILGITVFLCSCEANTLSPESTNTPEPRQSHTIYELPDSAFPDSTESLGEEDYNYDWNALPGTLDEEENHNYDWNALPGTLEDGTDASGGNSEFIDGIIGPAEQVDFMYSLVEQYGYDQTRPIARRIPSFEDWLTFDNPKFLDLRNPANLELVQDDYDLVLDALWADLYDNSAMTEITSWFPYFIWVHYVDGQLRILSSGFIVTGIHTNSAGFVDVDHIDYHATVDFFLIGHAAEPMIVVSNQHEYNYNNDGYYPY